MTIILCADCKYALKAYTNTPHVCSMRHRLTGFPRDTDLLKERNSLNQNDCGPEARFFSRKVETTVL